MFPTSDAAAGEELPAAALLDVHPVVEHPELAGEAQRDGPDADQDLPVGGSNEPRGVNDLEGVRDDVGVVAGGEEIQR